MKAWLRFTIALVLTAGSFFSFAQTSWKGTTSTSWSTAANWTAGIPTSAVDAIIGDANFTGVNQPTISATAVCKSLTLGGAVNVVLTVNKNLTASGNIIINASGTMVNGASSVTLTGNWVNNGTYTANSTSSSVIFGGTVESIQGGATTFRKLTINAGSVTTLTTNVTVSGAGSITSVKGTLNPGESPVYKLNTTDITVSSSAVLKVTGALFTDNYVISGTATLNAGSIVDYAATALNQTVSSAYSYSTLSISGSGTKSLVANLPALNASSSSYGKIIVNAGVFDLSSFIADRGTTVAGGSITVSNGASLKIGGTGTFPANYTTASLSLTSGVEYNGDNQTIAAKTYGNLKVSSSSGAVIKTFPSAAFTIAGNFTSSAGAGSAVSSMAAANMTISGQVNLGAGTTFNAGSYTIAVAGNWTNDGILIGGSSTVTMTGAGTVISGAGTHNFNSLTISASNITASVTNLSLSGNLATSGAGTFTYPAGTLTMSGAAKTVSGTNIILNQVSVTGSITTGSTLTVTGDLNTSGSFTQTAGTVIMSGVARVITGGGTIVFKTLQLTGTITALSGFTIGTALLVNGTFTASAGVATFTGSSTLNGTANLFDVTINGTSLILASGSILGIADVLTVTAGTLNTTSYLPNTVNYNGAVAQTVNALTFNQLIVSNGNTKTAAGNTTVNGNLTISAATTFAGGSYTHTLSGDWINNGTFSPGTGTVKLSGAANSAISGATTFNILTINKSNATLVVTLQSNISVPTINMTLGKMSTGSSTLTITGTRTGAGIIVGTITRTHAFTTGIVYAFEGVDNSILFTAVSAVTSVTVTVIPGNVADFPNSGAINREYAIAIPSGTYTATLRLHYEDAELNGSNEAGIKLWQSISGTWTLSGKTTNSTTSNYVEQNGLTDLSMRWTCSDDPTVLRWNGSASTAWANASNWTPGAVPSSIDVAQIGSIAFTNAPAISTAITVKSISFGSVQAATLTITTGGSLVTNGNITGTWSTNATHLINTGNQSLTVNGDLILSDGTAGHAINLSAGNNTIVINGSLTQSGGAGITISGTNVLNIKNDFNYSNGIFNPGTGTVNYTGTGAQVVAAVNYNNLTISKTAGIATVSSSSVIAGNLLVAAGELDFAGSSSITGDMTINAGAVVAVTNVTMNIGGNWGGSGTFTPGTGMVNFNGTSAQYISAATFNDLSVNKASGTATLSGNITLGGNLNVQSGTLDLVTYSANRNASGGQFALADGATLSVGGANNFPQNYTVNTIGSNSTVNYNGTATQSVTAVSYGNLVFTNGGTNAKTLAGSISVTGNFTISSAATADAASYTIALAGNWNNSGTFTPASGTVLLNGTGKMITGNTVFNRVTVYGTYTVAGTDITCNGLFNITPAGSFAAGSGTATVSGDLINSGIMTSAGTTTFTGTTLQTIRLVNAISSVSSGIVNFNGNVSPVLISTSTPVFANLNINNTAGINPSVNWLIAVSLTIGNGGIFNGGNSTHTIMGSFTNNGTVTSSGTLNFAPSVAATLNFGTASFSSTGIVTLGGSGPITIAGTPAALNDIRITNTNSAGITPSSDWTLGGDFITASNAIFNASSYTYIIGDDIESNGTLNGGTSTFIMNAASGLLTGSPNTTFNHFTVNGSVASTSDFNVAGDFTNNGTYDGSVGTLIMTGSNSAVIKGTTVPSAIAQLTIAKNGPASMVTLSNSVSNVFTLYINSGTLFTSSYGITQDAGGGLLAISNGAALRLGGNNSLPGFSAYGLDVYSTVEYAGSNQIVGNAASYGNLMITAAGTKVATVPLTVQNDFTLSAGTLNSAVSVVHTIGGNWTMSGGTFLNASSTILFNGAGNQSISSSGPFNNLTVNKATGLIALSGDVTVNAILSLTNGKISLGNNSLTMGNSGSIAGAGTNNYIIATGSGVLNQQVVAGNSKLFPVGLAAAYTPATVALTPGSTTDIFSVRMLNGTYSDGAGGGVITANAVNATWLITETVTGGSNASVSVQWPQSLELPGFNRTFSRLCHLYNNLWDYGSTDIPASGTGPYTLTRSGFLNFSPFSVAMFSALPVNWLSLRVSHKNNSNYIYWAVSAEVNNNYFAVEVAQDGIHFIEIGKVNGSGNVVSTQDYAFTHANIPDGIYYYRIKQVDKDGRFSYSSVVQITNENKMLTSMIISPNPVSNQATILMTAEKDKMVSVMITTISGQVIYTANEKLIAGISKIKINFMDKASGIYILKITDAQGHNEVIRFMKK